MGIATVGLGFMILLAGRPVYPVFTGAVSFLIGAYLMRQYQIAPTQWNPLLAFLFMAAVGFGAAFAFRRWVAYFAALVAGGYLVYYLPTAIGAQATFASPILFGIVGGVCLIAAFVIFDITIVVLASLLGATMILQYLRIATISSVVMFVILLAFGISAQFLISQYGSPVPD